jgi:hypothetical protein
MLCDAQVRSDETERKRARWDPLAKTGTLPSIGIAPVDEKASNAKRQPASLRKAAAHSETATKKMEGFWERIYHRFMNRRQ